MVAARIPHGSHLSACLRLDAAASADSICDPAWGSSTIAPMSWVSLRSDGPVVHDAHVLARGSRTRIHPRGSPPGAFFCRVSMDSSLAHGRSESLKQSGSSSPYDASSGRARPVRPKHCDGSACRPHRMLMSLNRARWAARPHVSKRRHPHSRADLKSPTISCRSSIGPSVSPSLACARRCHGRPLSSRGVSPWANLLHVGTRGPTHPNRQC